jgi:hypothetical protein
MDAKSINFTSRQSLGFFIAGKTDTEEGRREFEIFEKVTKFATDSLREKKVRPANVTRSLTDLSTVLFAVQDYAINEGIESTASLAYASAIVFAALSRYSTLMDRKRQSKSS